MGIEESLLANKKVSTTKLCCTKCNEIKDINDFPTNHRNKHGREKRCIKCKYEYSKNWISNNPERYNKLKKKYLPKLRIETLKAYGNKCVCCGETNKDTLQIDHINNDGAKERKNFGRSSGKYLYTKLRKLGYPKDNYQLLCANCNHIKGKFGRCNCQDYKKETISLNDVTDYCCL